VISVLGNTLPNSKWCLGGEQVFRSKSKCSQGSFKKFKTVLSSILSFWHLLTVLLFQCPKCVRGHSGSSQCSRVWDTPCCPGSLAEGLQDSSYCILWVSALTILLVSKRHLKGTDAQCFFSFCHLKIHLYSNRTLFSE